MLAVVSCSLELVFLELVVGLPTFDCDPVSTILYRPETPVS